MLAAFALTALAPAVSGAADDLPSVAAEPSSEAAGEGAPLPASTVFRAQIDRAVAAVYPALVRIEVVSTRAASGRLQKLRGSGSGTIIRPDGYVLTNHHVAGRATRLVCRLANRDEVEATLVGTDPLTDLAVIKLDLRGREEPLAVARFGDSDQVEVGDTVLAMGSPAGLSQSVTLGIASNIPMISPGGRSMRLDGENVGTLVRWIGHDAVIFPGNSGGPLVNLEGEVIGVNEVGIGSLGGAIPSNLAKVVAGQLIDTGRVVRAWTGIEPQALTKDLRAEVGGVLVAGVIAGSPAEEAGVLPGDVVTRYDGVAVNARSAEDLPVFNRLVLGTPVGKTVRLELLRDGQEAALDIVTRTREPARGEDLELREWGLTARDFTLMSALEYRRPDKRGILVYSLRPGGPGSEAKPALRPGDVILTLDGQAMSDISALAAFTRSFVAGRDAPEPVLVGFERGTRKYLTVVKLGPAREEDDPARPEKAWLGVGTQVLTRELGKALGLKAKKGVRLTEVFPDTPAAAAGLQVGDILLKLDGTVINASRPEHSEVLTNMVREYPADAEVEIDLIRDGEALTVDVELRPRPAPESELDQYENEDFEFTVRELSFGDRVGLRLPPDARGLVVQTVESAGWAALAGLNRGDIIQQVDGRPVASVGELRERMDAIKAERARRVVFFVRRGIHTLFIELEPLWDAPAGG